MLQFLIEKLDSRIHELQAAVYQPRLTLADRRFHDGPLAGGLPPTWTTPPGPRSAWETAGASPAGGPLNGPRRLHDITSIVWYNGRVNSTQAAWQRLAKNL